MEEGPELKVKHGHRDALRIRGSLLLQCAPLAVGCFLFVGVLFFLSASWDSVPFSLGVLG